MYLTKGAAVLLNRSRSRRASPASRSSSGSRRTNLTGDITEVPPEGSLLPETYIRRGMTRAEFLERMQQQAAGPRRRRCGSKRQPGLPFETPEEAIVLASIVEKETGRARRARARCGRVHEPAAQEHAPAVGSDHSLRAHRRQGALGRSDTRSEIDAKKTHNTYQIDGLPPTPICNPGLAAIEAALNPRSQRPVLRRRRARVATSSPRR